MKVGDLKGSMLDYWVAKAEGIDPSLDTQMRFMPSTDWSQGGPIIERERISLTEPDPSAWRSAWHANIARPEQSWNQTGETPLIAAMRAYVASKFGDEVE